MFGKREGSRDPKKKGAEPPERLNCVKRRETKAESLFWVWRHVHSRGLGIFVRKVGAGLERRWGQVRVSG